MKRLFLILFSLPLFIDFVGAYNCGTVSSRFNSFQTKRDNHEYEAQVLEARAKNLNSQYEREVRLNDAAVWDTVQKKLREEFDKLNEEINRCQSQREQISDYLEEASKYEQKLINAKNSDEFNQSDLDNAIKYYNKAYNLMKWDNWLSMWMEEEIKNRIDELSSVRDSINDWLKTLNKLADLDKEANKYFNSWEDEKALKLYKEIISYKSTFEFYDYSSAEKNINLLEQKKWQWNNESETSSIINNITNTYSSRSDEQIDAIQWMYDNWLTKHNTLQKFLPYNEITRDQASKFFVEFAVKVLWKNKWTIYNYNIFSDIDKADPTLKDYVIYANNMWLFKWSNWKFNPRGKLTKAQALAVAIRMVDWYLDESWRNVYDVSKGIWQSRYSEYVYRAIYLYNLNKWRTYSNFEKLNKQNITRWEMAILLYDMYLFRQNKCFQWELSKIWADWVCERLWTWSEYLPWI